MFRVSPSIWRAFSPYTTHRPRPSTDISSPLSNLNEPWPAPRRYERYAEGPPKLGWIFNMLPTSIPDASGNEKSGLDMYFLEQDGGTFKATVCLSYEYLYVPGTCY